jgi:hypothetical protein
MPDSAGWFGQRLVLRKCGATSHGKRERRLTVGKLAQVAKGCHLAIFFEDRNPGNERIAGR